MSETPSIAESSSPSPAPSPTTLPSVSLALTPAERSWPARSLSILEDVLGPDFFGPSSSHSAAPQRMARQARELLGGTPDRVHVELLNTYATSSEGHGTKGAILAGLLGMALTNPKTPNAEQIAERQGLHPKWEERWDKREKENTLIFHLQRGAIRLDLRAVSTGGGAYSWLNIHLATALTSSQGDDHECQ